MSRPKMLILRGNSAGAGAYPDEQGKMIAWPFGALHEWAATEYARRLGYEAVVIPVAGQPQSQTSPQATAALKKFFEDQTVTAFYGFSGGGYNLRHILLNLASNKPESLRRIDRIVVLGAPKQPKSSYEPATYNAIARKKVGSAGWKDVEWDVTYKIDPQKSALPSHLPKGLDPHMFGPDVLLAETPAGRYRDRSSVEED
jgi:hypothetical protein